MIFSDMKTSPLVVKYEGDCAEDSHSFWYYKNKAPKNLNDLQVRKIEERVDEVHQRTLAALCCPSFVRDFTLTH